MSKLVTITGTVTRLVPEDPERGTGSKVYFRPDDTCTAAMRDLDGKHQTASGEVHLYSDTEGRAVGDVCEMLWDVEDLQRAPKLQPAGKHKSRREKREEAADARARQQLYQTREGEPGSGSDDDDNGSGPPPIVG
jgi:hypothetical protein